MLCYPISSNSTLNSLPCMSQEHVLPYLIMNATKIIILKPELNAITISDLLINKVIIFVNYNFNLNVFILSSGAKLCLFRIQNFAWISANAHCYS